MKPSQMRTPKPEMKIACNKSNGYIEGVKRPRDHDGDTERELLLPFLMAERLACLS